jgi:hypothetical protein
VSDTAWRVRNETKGINYAGVRSLNFSSGRQRFIDSYNGNNCSITISNNDESTFVGDLGDQLRLIPSTNAYEGSAVVFWITSFVYNDEPGTMNNSTITILGEDNIARLGRARVNGVTTLGGTYSLYQARKMINDHGAPVNAAFTPGARSYASAQTWTGSVADFMRQCMDTEQGYLISNAGVGSPLASGGTITMYGRGADSREGKYIYSRSASTTAIGYQDIQRNKFFDIFANQVTVNPVGLAAQIESIAASIAAYGVYGADLTSNDLGTTGADGLASYLVQVLSDLNLLNVVISFSDKAQINGGNYPATNIYRDWASQINNLAIWRSILKYRQPGDSVDRELKVIATGFSVSATPGETVWTVYLAPFTIYNFFILNSTTQGILDESRLNWGVS